ncbi:hypothetical protein [Pseudoalteromonas viridis]|uniref:Uncharacterized protein n=1 Tax=Pseudoalteromonas viridis TaxID=339617 RepID=A0ABX7VC34_9GAMM|nr:hypothetical protein [Pseudoalteromonas viridis]QTL37381.1 hypothetical protein J5X90_21275 [Pseudoalteromonas viridis]
MNKMIKSALAMTTLTMLSATAQAAPQEWQGYYKGQCEVISPARGTLYQFPMSLEIGAAVDNKADWIIVYGEGERKSVRNYSLLTLNENLGHYAVDENNGVVIDQYLLNDEFLSLFEVGSTKLQASYKLDSNGSIDVNINTFSVDPIRESKVGQFVVSSYQGNTQQRCKLFKW